MSAYIAWLSIWRRTANFNFDGDKQGSPPCFAIYFWDKLITQVKTLTPCHKFICNPYPNYDPFFPDRGEFA